MPKIGRKTAEQKRADALYAFIRSECAKQTDVKNITGLARAMGISYPNLRYGLATGSISALTMNQIIHTLHMEPDAVARLHKI